MLPLYYVCSEIDLPDNICEHKFNINIILFKCYLAQHNNEQSCM